MAKYSITHTCGHTETVALFGPEKDRSRRIATLESRDCPACYKASQNETGAAVQAENDLPALVGTEKQIAYAASLRGKRFPVFLATAQAMRDDFGQRNAPPELTALLERVLTEVRQETSATFWIECGNDSDRDWKGYISKRARALHNA